MPNQLFLDFPTVKGDSEDGFVELIDWSWELGRTGVARAGSTNAKGEAYYGDVTITKRNDKASANLMKFIGDTTNVAAEVSIRCFPDGVDPKKEEKKNFYEMKMKRVVVVGMSTGGSNGEMIEQIVLNFGEFTYTNNILDDKHNVKSSNKHTQKILS